MAHDNPISRRALFRKSLGLGMTPEKDASENVETPVSQGCPATPPDPEGTVVAAEAASPEKIRERIAAEPAYRLLLPRLLAFCSEPRTAGDVREALLGRPEMRTAIHAPETLLSWMVEVGAIAGRKEEGRAETLWETTEEGLEAVAGYDPAERLRRLLDEEPAYRDIYRRVLEFCAEGRALPEIEALLRAHPALENPKVYPAYLVDRLEFAGALEWTGDKWQTTATGKPV
ncbi:MAG: hypothetical protein LBT74_13920 [Acidobacteriota bacterium]|jgi:hypothetical protein|nr:hypothetical protein [Acidobacteriota bacterium]